jgi:hypothetical protein
MEALDNFDTLLVLLKEGDIERGEINVLGYMMPLSDKAEAGMEIKVPIPAGKYRIEAFNDGSA